MAGVTPPFVLSLSKGGCSELALGGVFITCMRQRVRHE